MATIALNFKLDDSRVLDINKIASVFHMTKTDVINEALDLYFSKMKNDPYYKLSVNVMEASKEESMEILDAIGKLTDEDMKISSSKTFTV